VVDPGSYNHARKDGQMDQSRGSVAVIAIAILDFFFALYFLSGAVLTLYMRKLVDEEAFRPPLTFGILSFGIGGLGIVSGVGVLQNAPWTRVVTISFAGLWIGMLVLKPLLCDPAQDDLSIGRVLMFIFWAAYPIFLLIRSARPSCRV
jgi:hypothetical protein